MDPDFSEMEAALKKYEVVSLHRSLMPIFEPLKGAFTAYEMLLAGRNISDSRSESVAFFREKIALASYAFDRLVHKMEKDLVETLQNASNR